MKNKKGFSLLELLFVITLLVIIALIFYPKVLNEYNDAKKSSFLTEAKAIINESSKKYSVEHLKGNKINFISDNAKNKLSLSNNRLKYCVNLGEKGEVNYAKISDGEYFIDGSGQNIKNSTISLVKRGNFYEFDCDYILNENDLIDDSPINFISNVMYTRIMQILSIAFILTLVLSIVLKRNQR